MNIEQAIEVLRSLITTCLMVVGPILIAAMIVGVAVSLFQSVTSIQEQTLTFVPKLVAIGVVMIAAAPWILRTLMEFTIDYFTRLPDMAR